MIDTKTHYAATIAVGAAMLGALLGTVPAHAVDAACIDAETPRMSVSDTATVSADRSSFPAFRAAVSGGEVVCQVGELDAVYQDVLVRLADGREGIALPQSFAELPSNPPATFDYSAPAALATGVVYAYPSTSADTSSTGAGASVAVDRSFEVDGPAGFATALFVPVRTEAGVEGWVLAADLVEAVPEPSGSATAGPGSTGPAAPDESTEPNEAGFDLARIISGIPTPVWVAVGGVLSLGAIAGVFLRPRGRAKSRKAEELEPGAFTSGAGDVVDAYDDGEDGR